jgi:RNA polymerase sigma factor (sigma-70 family)
LKDHSDEDLMILYRDDSMAAFEVLYQRYNERVYAYLHHKIDDRGAVDDVFQKTFMKLHSSRERFKGDVAFNKWIFTICKSELIDYFRRQTRELKRSQSLPMELNVEQNYEQSGKLADNERIANLLSRDEQRILSLRYDEDLEFQEIGEKIGLSAGSVRKRVSRIIAKLRKGYESIKHG